MHQHEILSRCFVPSGDTVVVLNYGKKIFEGTADQTKNSKEVIEAYLGVDE